jgi:hypothetical protein
MSNLEKFLKELNTPGTAPHRHLYTYGKNQEFKHIKIFVPTVNKDIDFVITLLDIGNGTEINEYIYGLDSTLEEMEEIEIWVQELGGASKIAKSIGLVDKHYI